MSRLLLFDLGGVLVENDMFAALSQMMNVALDDAALKAKWLRSDAARAFELGHCSPKQFSESIIKEFELEATAPEFLQAFSGWPKPLSLDAINLLSDLRQQHRTACLSNSNVVHWTDHIESHFDHAYSSHLMGRIKPDVEVLEFVTRDLQLTPAEITFFDDSAPNVDAALAFGWDAHLTQGFDELKRSLRKLNFLS